MTKLGLKGNELIIYALIYSFSKDGKSKYYGSLNYITTVTGASRRTVINSLSSLIDKGYIKKELHNTQQETNKYSVDLEVVQKLHYGSAKIAQGVVQKLHSGSAKTAPNNNIIINNIYKDDFIYSDFQEKFFDYRNMKEIEKLLVEQFIELWAKNKDARYGEGKTVLKMLTEYTIIDLLNIRSKYSTLDLKKALAALFQQKVIKSKTQHDNPKHILNAEYFAQWLQAYANNDLEFYKNK